MKPMPDVHVYNMCTQVTLYSYCCNNVVYYNIHCTVYVFVFTFEITHMLYDELYDVNHTLQFYLAQCQSDCRVRTWLPQQDLMLEMCSCLNN